MICRDCGFCHCASMFKKYIQENGKVGTVKGLNGELAAICCQDLDDLVEVDISGECIREEK